MNNVLGVKYDHGNLHDLRKHKFLERVGTPFLKIFLFFHPQRSSGHRYIRYIVDERIPLTEGRKVGIRICGWRRRNLQDSHSGPDTWLDILYVTLLDNIL